MTEHEYEVRCTCGNAWRVRLEHDESAEPTATCLACGADTFDLTDIGEIRSAGPGTT